MYSKNSMINIDMASVRIAIRIAMLVLSGYSYRRVQCAVGKVSEK